MNSLRVVSLVHPNGAAKKRIKMVNTLGREMGQLS
jgi:hypothetical protein